MESMHQGLQRGFMDRTIAAPATYTPSYITNDDQQQVLPTLLAQLKTCESFDFSVAFITEQGLAMLKTALYELHLRGGKGRIITSTYLSFNQPNVFRELLKLPNVSVRITNVEGFHAKGYIFKQQDHISFLVGSSNLTATALKKNYEWNVKLTSLQDGELVSNFVTAFETLWQDAHVIDEQWLASYRSVYVAPPRPTKKTPLLIADPAIPLISQIQPNAMQEAALKEIEAVRTRGEKRALVVSATGTGKTYLSAFAVNEAKPKRFLFIVHREQILRKACKDYEKIIGGPSSDYQLLTGNEKNYDAKYLFATIQTLAKDEVLQQFAAETFDYIIVDEVHKAGASSYLKVINYFQPQFMLGMTATPERTDDFNIFELFHYNVAYEIRLQEALEADMLSPFHYFGVTDIVGGEENTTFADLVEDERVEHIIQKVDYYGYFGDVVKGLVFCSSKKEAEALSEKFTARKLPSVALTGDDSQVVREQVVAQLEAGEINYIFTVDIFNEGVDIPAVNQVILLRQTASSIVFIQQLGRGLRKHPDKDFVTVLDFIGNYKNNYMIPIALSGDQTLNKDNARRQTFDPTFIKGISTINFEEIARQRIYDSIKTASLSSFTNVKKAYEALAMRLGTIPQLSDFLHHHSVDPEVVINVAKNYPRFLQRVKVETTPLTDIEDKILTMLSVELINGKRIQEVCLLEQLLQGPVDAKSFKQQLLEQNYDATDATIRSMERVLTLEFFKSPARKKYGNQPLIRVKNGRYELAIDTSNPWFVKQIKEIIVCARIKNQRYVKNGLTLYQKYSRKDVCRILNWDSDESATINGYLTKHQTCPLFITYHKDETLTSDVHYEDELLTPNLLEWYTRHSRKVDSPEVQTIIKAQEKDIDVHVFIKKDGSEGGDFFYLGEAKPLQETVKQLYVTDNKGKEVSIVAMNMALDHAVKHEIYHYLKEA